MLGDDDFMNSIYTEIFKKVHMENLENNEKFGKDFIDVIVDEFLDKLDDFLNKLMLYYNENDNSNINKKGNFSYFFDLNYDKDYLEYASSKMSDLLKLVPINFYYSVEKPNNKFCFICNPNELLYFCYLMRLKEEDKEKLTTLNYKTKVLNHKSTVSA